MCKLLDADRITGARLESPSDQSHFLTRFSVKSKFSLKVRVRITRDTLSDSIEKIEELISYYLIPFGPSYHGTLTSEVCVHMGRDKHYYFSHIA